MTAFELLTWSSFLWITGMAYVFVIRLSLADKLSWFGVFALPLTTLAFIALGSFVNFGLQALQGG